MEPDDPDTADLEARARRPRTGPAEVPDGPTATLEGYLFGEVIGRGGIGEVIAAHDLRIGRDVAVKRLRTAAPTEDDAARFLREARVQARLDHPAIAPVYELGRDAENRPYFTMKRLTGVTLRELLATPEPNRARLLRAFAEVCAAIDFAHERGIVHRDLKPANIMLGDYGDVYVIDWGLARVVGEAVAEIRGAIEPDDDASAPGLLLGTPGYVAPELLEKAALAGRPVDIYALGAILFELLAGESLLPRGSQPALAAADEPSPSPALRRPDRTVPPELDALCVAMLAHDASARPTAKHVAERVQAYLDGDRDVERRTKMAVDLVWNARAMLDDGRSTDALRSAGRALALDPQSADAASLVGAIVLAPPAVSDAQPPELKAALHEADLESVSRHARIAMGAYAAIGGFVPFAVWNGVRRWDLVIAMFGIAALLALAAWRISSKPERTFGEMIGYALGNVVLIMLLSRVAGPFTFVPALTCVIAMSVMAYPVFILRSGVLIGILALGYLAPLVLEATGLAASTWEIRPGELVSHAGALRLEGAPTAALLVAVSVAMIVIAGINAARIYRQNREARIKLATQAWHLRHLLPS